MSQLTEQEARRIINERDDRAMILHPQLWENNILFLKKREQQNPLDPNNHGVLIPGKPYKVYPGLIGMTISKDNFIIYEDVDQLLADGWVVD